MFKKKNFLVSRLEFLNWNRGAGFGQSMDFVKSKGALFCCFVFVCRPPLKGAWAPVLLSDFSFSEWLLDSKVPEGGGRVLPQYRILNTVSVHIEQKSFAKLRVLT